MSIHSKALVVLCSIVALGLVSCASPTSTADQVAPAPNAPPPVSMGEDVDTPVSHRTRTSSATQRETPPIWQPEPQRRIRKRLNVDQLGQAILRVSDGLKWRQGNDDDLLNTLALTLGKPDYLEVTRENLETSVLFMKFLEDAAGSVCRQMIDRDLAENTQILIPNGDEIPPHIAGLLAHFHSRSLSVEHPDIKQWVWLYESAITMTDDIGSVWHTVCVALMRHPDFYTY